MNITSRVNNSLMIGQAKKNLVWALQCGNHEAIAKAVDELIVTRLIVMNLVIDKRSDTTNRGEQK